jgi:hypothetical protein
MFAAGRLTCGILAAFCFPVMIIVVEWTRRSSSQFVTAINTEAYTFDHFSTRFAAPTTLRWYYSTASILFASFLLFVLFHFATVAAARSNSSADVEEAG